MLRFASPLALVCFVVGAIALDAPPAAACQADRPCRRQKVVRIEPSAYKRAIRGPVPAWTRERVTKFLTGSVWRPVLAAKATPTYTRLIQPEPFVFVEEARVDDLLYDGRVVIIGRIAKQDSAILVEIDGATWKLGACAGNKAHACLVPARSIEIVDID